MASLNAPISAAGSNPAYNATMLASLANSLGSGGGLAGLFESLLASADNVTVPQNNNNVSDSSGSSTSSSVTSSSTTTETSDSTTPTLGSGSLSDIISALQDFTNKWSARLEAHHHDNNQNANGNNTQQQSASSGSNGTTTSTTSNSTTSNNTTSTNTSETTSTQQTTTTSGDSNSSTSGSSTTDPNAPPSFADLLSQLQGILQMLQKQILAAQTAGSTSGTTASTNGTTSSPSSIQDLLTAGGVLGDLLALAQILEKKLGAQTASNDPTQNTNTASTDPNLAALDTQLRTNLKTLMDNLQTAASNTSPASTATTTATDTTTGLGSPTDTTLVTTTPATTPTDTTATTTTSYDIIQNALATADDFLKQINSLYSTGSSTVAATIATTTDPATVATGGGSDTSFGADQNGSNANAGLTNAGTLTTTAQTTNTDATKSSNPYSFASQLSALRAQLGGTTGLPSAVEQVLLQLNRNAKSGNDQMSIQLHPADLGTINVKLSFGSDGTVTGNVVASNPDTLAMLQKDSRGLERALQDAGLRADPGSLQFNLGGQSNNNSQQTTQNQNTATTNTAGGSATPDLNGLIADIDNSMTNSWVITPGRVNIQV